MNDSSSDPGALTHVSCLACAYDLTGLDHATTCPECGAPIARHIRRLRVGTLSLHALRRARRGILLFALGFVLTALGAGLVTFVVPPTALSVATIIGLPLLLTQAGWWEIAAPDCRAVAQPWAGSWALRMLTALIVLTACTLAVLIMRAPGGPGGWWLNEVHIVLGVTAAFLFMARAAVFSALLDRFGQRLDAPELGAVGRGMVRIMLFTPLLSIPILIVMFVISAMLSPGTSGTGHLILGALVGLVCLTAHVGSVLWLGAVTSARIRARRDMVAEPAQ